MCLFIDPFKVTFSTLVVGWTVVRQTVCLFSICLSFGGRSSIFQAFLSFLTALFQFLKGRPLETLPSILYFMISLIQPELHWACPYHLRPISPHDVSNTI